MPPGRQSLVPAEIHWTALAPRAADRARALDELADILGSSQRLTGLLRDARECGEAILLCVNDGDRATPTREVLQALSRLPAAAHAGARFAALVATGTHRFSAAERAVFERDTFDNCGLPIEQVSWHDADARAEHVSIGGLRFDLRLAQHRFLLPIGSIEPHYFAGATGAHKTVTIGVLSRADIEQNHRGALDPASDVLALHGNPVFDGVAAALHTLMRSGRRIAAVNLVVVDGAWIDASAGEPLESLHALLPLARSVYSHTVAQPADVLHLRVPAPLGRSLYQADKALKNNHRAVRDRGWIVLEAECSLGVGPAAFLTLLRDAPDYAGAVATVAQRGYRLGDHKAVKLRHLTDSCQRGVRVLLASRNVSAADAALCGLQRFDSVDAALRAIPAAASEEPLNGLRVEDAGNVCVQPGGAGGG